MSRFANLFTYSWSSTIYDNPFKINAFGVSAEDARQEVLAILAEIVRLKPQNDALEKEGNESLAYKHVAQKAPKSWTQPEKVPRSYEEIRDEQRALIAEIPAEFFNGSFSAGTFDYTPDQIVGFRDQTLADFIRTTEPTCLGPARMVSFHSCLNG